MGLDPRAVGVFGEIMLARAVLHGGDGVNPDGKGNLGVIKGPVGGGLGGGAGMIGVVVDGVAEEFGGGKGGVVDAADVT